MTSTATRLLILGDDSELISLSRFTVGTRRILDVRIVHDIECEVELLDDELIGEMGDDDHVSGEIEFEDDD